jgi:hypothetical protein
LKVAELLLKNFDRLPEYLCNLYAAGVQQDMVNRQHLQQRLQYCPQQLPMLAVLTACKILLPKHVSGS